MPVNANAPIGIFDSGIGGLTVVKSVIKQLPGEDIIYFGDTARVPYGTKSQETVKEYALQITQFLLQKKVKLILIACNTVSASAESAIRELAGSVPVFGVIEAGAKIASEINSSPKLIGVIGTLATVVSGAYERAIKKQNPGISVFSKACPMLVPLAEEGWTHNDVARKTLEIYLDDFRTRDLDALILGCTHYPLFKDMIVEVLGNSNTRIIDSADVIAEQTHNFLKNRNLLNPQKQGRFDCYVSDKPQRFQQLAGQFLGKPLNRIEVVSMG